MREKNVEKQLLKKDLVYGEDLHTLAGTTRTTAEPSGSEHFPPTPHPQNGRNTRAFLH